VLCDQYSDQFAPKLGVSISHSDSVVCFLPLYHEYISLASLFCENENVTFLSSEDGESGNLLMQIKASGLFSGVDSHSFQELCFCPGSLECIVLQLPPGNLQTKSSGNVFIQFLPTKEY